MVEQVLDSTPSSPRKKEKREEKKREKKEEKKRKKEKKREKEKREKRRKNKETQVKTSMRHLSPVIGLKTSWGSPTVSKKEKIKRSMGKNLF